MTYTEYTNELMDILKPHVQKVGLFLGLRQSSDFLQYANINHFTSSADQGSKVRLGVYLKNIQRSGAGLKRYIDQKLPSRGRLTMGQIAVHWKRETGRDYEYTIRTNGVDVCLKVGKGRNAGGGCRKVYEIELEIPWTVEEYFTDAEKDLIATCYRDFILNIMPTVDEGRDELFGEVCESNGRWRTVQCGEREIDRDRMCDQELGEKDFEKLVETLMKSQLSEIIAREREERAKFNILDVLGLSDYEIRHSFMLAWLLDSKANHGLGNVFLKAFVGEIIRLNADRGFDYSSLKNLGESGSLEVTRETENIDILLVDESNKVVLAIENKWDAEEREDTEDRRGQLGKYYDYLSAAYRANECWRVNCVFLSPTGRPPSENYRDTWGVCSYKAVLEAFNNCMGNNKQIAAINPDVNVLIQHYKKIIERKVNMNEKTQKICEKIYQEHRAELDYIFQFVDRRPELLVKIAEGVEVELNGHKETLKGENDAPTYVQFRQRLPKSVGGSVHYEITFKHPYRKALVELHIEKWTDIRIKESLISEIGKLELTDGFMPRNNGIKKELDLRNMTQDEAVKKVKEAVQQLYALCEPTLLEYEKQK